MRALSSTLEGSTVSPLRSMRSFQATKPRHLEALLDEAKLLYSNPGTPCQAMLGRSGSHALRYQGSTSPPTEFVDQTTDFASDSVACDDLHRTANVDTVPPKSDYDILASNSLRIYSKPTYSKLTLKGN